MAASRLCIGGLKGPHGLQGWLKAKLKVADPSLVLQAGEISLENGVSYRVVGLKPVGQGLTALQLAGITTVEQAESLRGPLYIARSALGLRHDELLVQDLIGLLLRCPQGNEVGPVQAVQDLPAGPALLIKPTNPGAEKAARAVLIPLDPAFITVGESTPPTLTLTELGSQLLTL